MSKEFAREFYNSTAWKACREAYKKKMCYLCERCGAPGVIVHHKIRVTPATINNPEVLLNFDNLMLLCRECHRKEHEQEFKTAQAKRHDQDDDRRYYFGKNGEVISK